MESGGHLVPIEVERLQQRPHLPSGEFARAPDGDARDGERSDPDPAQAGDGDAHLLHHPPHHPVQPLLEGDRQRQTFAALPQQPELLWHDPVPVDHDAVPHPLQGSVGRTTEGEDVVLLRQPVARMHHPVGDVTVVGQEQQALGVAVEPTDWIDPLPDVDQVHDRPPVPLVAGRRNVAPRLVEQDVARFLGTQQRPIDSDLGRARVDLGPELGDDLAVDRDAASLNHPLRAAAGGDTAGREDSLEALARLDLGPSSLGRRRHERRPQLD